MQGLVTCAGAGMRGSSYVTVTVCVPGVTEWEAGEAPGEPWGCAGWAGPGRVPTRVAGIPG